MVFFFTINYMQLANKYPVGIFDSGIGGLSVWKEIVKLLPNEDIIYYADSGNCPYGKKSQQEIINISEKIVDFLITQNCKLIIVACNTATAAAIEHLRAKYNIKFVGMEPAVKPAALNSITGKIGVLATSGTFRGKLFNETSKQYANDKDVHIQIGHGLVNAVENGLIKSKETRELLQKYLQPMLDNNVDQIVLGCTHYPFLIDIITQIVDGRAKIIDPSYAVAKQAENLLNKDNLQNSLNKIANYKFYSTGNTKLLKTVLNQLAYNDLSVEAV